MILHTGVSMPTCTCRMPTSISTAVIMPICKYKMPTSICKGVSMPTLREAHHSGNGYIQATRFLLQRAAYAKWGLRPEILGPEPRDIKMR